MNKEFIPYEQILELKELGFNGILWQEAFRWFRERYSILLYKDYGKVPHFTIIQNLMFENHSITYEEAELECLKKLIEIVKNK